MPPWETGQCLAEMRVHYKFPKQRAALDLIRWVGRGRPVISLTSFLVTYQTVGAMTWPSGAFVGFPLPLNAATAPEIPSSGSLGFDPLTLLDFPVLSKHS